MKQHVRIQYPDSIPLEARYKIAELMNHIEETYGLSTDFFEILSDDANKILRVYKLILDIIEIVHVQNLKDNLDEANQISAEELDKSFGYVDKDITLG